MAAPYQLPAPFSRAVALPDQRGLLIAGGLTAAHTTTDAVIRLNPVTGQTSQAGRLAVATHDAGQTSSQCLHDPPHRFGSPNGAFPLTDGHYLVTEINGATMGPPGGG